MKHQYNHKKLFLFLLLILLHLPTVFGENVVVSPSGDQEKSILIINSYNPSLKWSKTFTDPIFNAFSNQKPRINIHIDHMNMFLIHSNEELAEYKLHFAEKYKNHQPEVILFLGNSSWVLLKDYVTKKWPNTPVVLCAESDYIGTEKAYIEKQTIPKRERIPLQDITTKQQLTILHVPYFMKESIALMQRMIPLMDTLVFITDGRYVSAQNRDDLADIIREKYPKVVVKNLIAGQITTDMLIDSLKNAKKQTGILFQSWYLKDIQSGNLMISSNISRILSYYSTAPIFALDNLGIEENGLVGCYYFSEKKIAESIVNIVENALSGTQTTQIEIRTPGQPAPIFNYKDLINNRLSPNLCPPDSIFYMKPPTFWQRNKGVIALSLLLIIVLFILLRTWWISKQKSQQNEKLRMMTSYNSLIENMPIVYLKHKAIYNQAGVIIDYTIEEANPRFEKYFDSLEAVLGKKGSEIDQDNIQNFVNLYNLTTTNKKEITFQYYSKPKDCFMTIIVTKSKEKGYFDVFCVDNTELSKTQETLRSVNHKLSMALDIANIVPWKWNLEKGTILCDVNRPVELSHDNNQIDESQLSVPDYQYFAKIHKQDRERIKTAYKQLVEGEIHKIKEEYRIIAQQDGKRSLQWVEVQAAVDQCDEHGKPLTLIGSSLVITNRKAMEEDLICAKEKAEESNRLKSAFLANMSHEIRTPLNAIVGFSGILASTEEEEEKNEYVNIIENNNALLLQLIEDILDLSKIEAGTLDFCYSNNDLHLLFQELESSAQLRRPNEEVEICYEAHLPDCYVYIEKNRLTQVVINMINNAMKFTTEGSIRFGYKLKDTNYLYFYVTDTGCGIPKDKIESIFGRFVKLNNFVQGTGLGLSICQTIIEHMGGQIGVQSQEGTGSTFWFTLPYQPKGRIEVEQKEYKQEMIERAKLTILIAEDNESNFRLFDSILRKEYRIIHAWDGEEAIKLFKEHNPHLVLMDINMPKINGYEATQQIRALSPSIPIMAITAYAYAEDEQRILNSGFNGYTSKPINAQKLRGDIVSLLKRHLIFM